MNNRNLLNLSEYYKLYTHILNYTDSTPPLPPVEFIMPSFDNGNVYSIEPDGVGGFYVGGSFTSITDKNATYTSGFERLCHLNPDGTVDTNFSCPVSDNVNKVCLYGDFLYVAGDFNGTDTVGGVIIRSFCRVYKANTVNSGIVDISFNLNPSGGGSPGPRVKDFIIHNNKIYICGNFTSLNVGGSFGRRFVARISINGNNYSVDSWNPGLGPTYTTAYVAYCIYLDHLNNELYIGGNFYQIGGVNYDFPMATVSNLACVTTGTISTLKAWNPYTNTFNARVYDILVANNNVYFTGVFSSLGDASADFPPTSRNNFASVTNTEPSVLNSWNPSIGTSSFIGGRCLFYDNDNDILYMSGRINKTIGSFKAYNICRTLPGISDTLDTTWADNICSSLATVSTVFKYQNKIIIGGNFTYLNGEEVITGGVRAGILSE